MKKANKNKGFTLIELIVVIAILVALLLMLVPKLSGFTETAADTAALNNLKQLDKAFTSTDIKARVQEGYQTADNIDILIPYNESLSSINKEYEKRVTELMEEMIGEEMTDRYIIFRDKNLYYIKYYPDAKRKSDYYQYTNGTYSKCTGKNGCKDLNFAK